LHDADDSGAKLARSANERGALGLLFTAIFIAALPGHFSQESFAYAAAQGVPFPSMLVPLSGLLALAGTLSIVFGFHARIGALLLIAFLIPVTLLMHDFWNVADPQQRMMQRVRS
jgi:putative oxidoreductase